MKVKKGGKAKTKPRKYYRWRKVRNRIQAASRRINRRRK